MNMDTNFVYLVSCEKDFTSLFSYSHKELTNPLV